MRGNSVFSTFGLLETASKRNVASYCSAMSASDVKVIEEMEDDELYLEIVNPKR